MGRSNVSIPGRPAAGRIPVFRQRQTGAGAVLFRKDVSGHYTAGVRYVAPGRCRDFRRGERRAFQQEFHAGQLSGPHRSRTQSAVEPPFLRPVPAGILRFVGRRSRAYRQRILQGRLSGAEAEHRNDLLPLCPLGIDLRRAGKRRHRPDSAPDGKRRGQGCDGARRKRRFRLYDVSAQRIQPPALSVRRRADAVCQRPQSACTSR